MMVFVTNLDPYRAQQITLKIMTNYPAFKETIKVNVVHFCLLRDFQLSLEQGARYGLLIQLFEQLLKSETNPSAGGGGGT